MYWRAARSSQAPTAVCWMGFGPQPQPAAVQLNTLQWPCVAAAPHKLLVTVAAAPPLDRRQGRAQQRQCSSQAAKPGRAAAALLQAQRRLELPAVPFSSRDGWRRSVAAAAALVAPPAGRCVLPAQSAPATMLHLLTPHRCTRPAPACWLLFACNADLLPGCVRRPDGRHDGASEGSVSGVGDCTDPRLHAHIQDLPDKVRGGGGPAGRQAGAHAWGGRPNAASHNAACVGGWPASAPDRRAGAGWAGSHHP